MLDLRYLRSLYYYKMRRRSTPYYVFAVIFLVLLINTWYKLKYSDLGSSAGLSSWKNDTVVIRPGDFYDHARHQRQSQLPQEEEVQGEPSFGTAHDVRNENFYNQGLSSLSTAKTKPVVYDPYPDYNSGSWRRRWKGKYRPCVGPRGTVLDRRSPDDAVSVYMGNQQDFPFPTFGSYEAMNLDGEVCLDRFSRYGLYGYGDDQIGDIPGYHRPPRTEWRNVDWWSLQSKCLLQNENRYRTLSIDAAIRKGKVKPGASNDRLHPRSAVLIRTWHDMPWTASDIHYLRSIIVELALHSGAEYQVFLLCHVRDPELSIDSSEDVEALKDKYIPREFWNMVVFFNDKMLQAWYPKVEEHRPIFQHLQPVQIFAQEHTQFDYFWQFEMDARYIGHLYHFLDRAISFAREQPRKYLWERNAYFYAPEAHGTWKDFVTMVDTSMTGRPSVWGPVPIDEEVIIPMGPKPPVADPKDDNYKWGVGEEADLITWLPIFDPEHTHWTFPNKVYSFKQGLQTPRRASVITMWRMSNRLLDSIHQAQTQQGLGLVSEMTAPSWALYHGLKAVRVPHPIYLDGKWGGKELATVFNPGEPEKISGGENSIWNWDHKFDHIIYRFTYMFTTHTAEDFFRYWMGYGDDGRGGKEFEKEHGRPCYPPMFLHTIKNPDARRGPNRPAPTSG